MMIVQRKVFVLAAVAIAAFFIARPAGSQDIGSLYGSKNIQFINIRGIPSMMPDTGYGGELMFGFNTLSKRTEFNESWIYYYGVELGGGNMSWLDSDVGDYDSRDASFTYGLLQFEGKLFAQDKGKVRPYLGWHGGIGYGSLIVERVDDYPEMAAQSAQIFTGGVELGAHFGSGSKYWLVAGAGIDARYIQIPDGGEFSYPAYFTIGVSKWLGPL